jgi:hypothetical protein
MVGDAHAARLDRGREGGDRRRGRRRRDDRPDRRRRGERLVRAVGDPSRRPGSGLRRSRISVAVAGAEPRHRAVRRRGSAAADRLGPRERRPDGRNSRSRRRAGPGSRRRGRRAAGGACFGAGGRRRADRACRSGAGRPGGCRPCRCHRGRPRRRSRGRPCRGGGRSHRQFGSTHRCRQRTCRGARCSAAPQAAEARIAGFRPGDLPCAGFRPGDLPCARGSSNGCSGRGRREAVHLAAGCFRPGREAGLAPTRGSRRLRCDSRARGSDCALGRRGRRCSRRITHDGQGTFEPPARPRIRAAASSTGCSGATGRRDVEAPPPCSARAAPLACRGRARARARLAARSAPPAGGSAGRSYDCRR